MEKTDEYECIASCRLAQRRLVAASEQDHRTHGQQAELMEAMNLHEYIQHRYQSRQSQLAQFGDDGNTGEPTHASVIDDDLSDDEVLAAAEAVQAHRKSLTQEEAKRSEMNCKFDVLARDCPGPTHLAIGNVVIQVCQGSAPLHKRVRVV